CGDLLPLAGVDYRAGNSRASTGLNPGVQWVSWNGESARPGGRRVSSSCVSSLLVTRTKCHAPTAVSIPFRKGSTHLRDSGKPRFTLSDEPPRLPDKL